MMLHNFRGTVFNQQTYAELKKALPARPAAPAEGGFTITRQLTDAPPKRPRTVDPRALGAPSGPPAFRRLPPAATGAAPAGGRSTQARGPDAPGGGPQRPRSREGAAPRPMRRVDDDGEEGTRRRGRKGGAGNRARSAPKDDDRPTRAERAYEEECRTRAEMKEVLYQPGQTTLESLVGRGPALAAGARGAAETVERLLSTVAPAGWLDDGVRRDDLARELLRGGMVYFRSAEEKDSVLALARALREKAAAARSERKAELVEVGEVALQTLDETQRATVLEPLLAGRYAVLGGGPRVTGLIRDVWRQAGRNETYWAADESALARKIGSMLPAQRPAALRRPRAANR